MTEEELTLFRLRLAIDVRDTALQQMTAALRAAPGTAQVLRSWATKVREQVKTQTVPELDPALSDLAAAEYQQAVEEMFAALGL